MEVLQSKDRLIKTMAKDLETIVSKIQANYTNLIPKSSIDKISKMFTYVFNLLTIPKSDFDDYMNRVNETFGNNGKFLLESCLAVREDCDSTFRKQIMTIYNNFISKVMT